MAARPLNILLIYDCLYPTSLGGVEYRNYCLAEALAARGHQVTLAGWGEPPAAPLPAGVTMLRLPFERKLHDQDGKRGVLPTLLFTLAMLRLRLGDYDVVETANIPYLHILPLALQCWLVRKPLIVTWHEYFGDYWRHYKVGIGAILYQAIERLVAQCGNLICAPSEFTRHRIAKARKTHTAAPLLLPNGVWLKQVQDVRQRPPIEAPPLLYAGRLIPEKRLELLLRAVALLPDSWSQQPLLGIVGDGTERARLQRLTAELGLEPRVKFYGRLPAIEDMWHLLAHTQIAVQPSQREGFGLFPLEALALGKPVIYCEGTENAIGDVVRHGIEGLCSPPTPEALSKTIVRLMTDPAAYAALASNAKDRAEAYDWLMVAKQAESLFYEAVSTG